MRRTKILLIRRENGRFHHPTKKRTVKACRPGAGIGVFVEFSMSPLDYDLRYLFENEDRLYWVPTVDDLVKIQNKLDQSDEETFKMLKTEWSGLRPRKLKVSDFC